eukprot:m.48440 g.48440  ORF g.48440 m.48440 type:complete len:73 (-) comp6033_c0_seq1:3919-4137(-)
MRFERCEPPSIVDVLLPRRSLYIMRDTIRNDYTHAVLPGPTLVWKGETMTRSRRIVVLFRDPAAGRTDARPY